jgi:hypothetical protein
MIPDFDSKIPVGYLFCAPHTIAVLTIQNNKEFHLAVDDTAKPGRHRLVLSGKVRGEWTGKSVGWAPAAGITYCGYTGEP